jgi:prepilin-type N-terminal cleavage/methylation domain-containing protein
VVISSRKRAFTLIELLVVISIIAMLVSLLLPVLSESRMQAIRLLTSSRIRTLGVTFQAYAADNKLNYPYFRRAATTAGNSIQAPWGCYAYSTTASDLAAYNCVLEYGAMPATAHPAVGTPTWDKSLVGDPTITPATLPTQGRGFSSPYALCFGYTGKAPSSSTSWTGTPLRIDKAKPAHNLVGDMVTAKVGGSVDSYIFTHPKRFGQTQVQSESYTPGTYPAVACDVLYRENPPAGSRPTEMVGAYMGKSDGSVLWYPVNQMSTVVATNVIQPLPKEGLFFKCYPSTAAGATGVWNLAGAGDF